MASATRLRCGYLNTLFVPEPGPLTVSCRSANFHVWHQFFTPRTEAAAAGRRAHIQVTTLIELQLAKLGALAEQWRQLQLCESGPAEPHVELSKSEAHWLQAASAWAASAAQTSS
jgi:hypothetical protein